MRTITVRAHRKKKTWKVHRRGKTYTARARKKTWTVKRKDIGYLGKGSPTGVKIPVRAGRLKAVGYSTSLPASKRHAALDRAVKKYGATTVWRMLNAQVIFRKHARNGAKRVFLADREYIHKKYRPDVARAARRKWMSMSPRARAKAMPGGAY